VGELCDSGVAVPAGDVLMDTLCIEDLTYIIVPLSPLFVNPSQLPILMAHETVFLVSGPCRGKGGERKYNQ
jgi:hypothetical protein